jgi:glycosyltransferase involved in cell wall biosynthesis
MANKKILLLAHEDLYGGGTRQTYYIMEALVKRGYETILVSNAEITWLGQTIRQTGLPIKTYYTPLICRKIRPLQELKLFFYLLRIFREEKPDVVFASGVKLIGLTGVAGWLAHIPKRVAIIRGEGAPPGSRLLQVIYQMEWLVARLGMTFITVSEYIRRQMLQRRIADDAAITAIHDGIDPTTFQPDSLTSTEQAGIFTKRYQLPPNAFKIGMVGRFVPGKRYDQFIEMLRLLCQRHRQVYGFLVGEGEHRERLQTLINESGFAHRIFIAGYCADMPAVYRDLDLTVLFTDYEGCPNSILESFAAGVPVVASDVCGISELIEPGRNGYLIPPGNMQEAVRIISPLVSSSALLKIMGEHGSRTVMEKFNLVRQVARVVESLFPLDELVEARGDE